MSCDSDWAAYPKIRRSASGIVLKIGIDALRTWRTTQATVALSSGKAEFVAKHQGVIEALAARSLLSEVFGKDFKTVVDTDSSAARAMALRVGPGGAKGIALRILLIQELAKAKIVESKINTLKNPADLLTKAVDQNTLTRLLVETAKRGRDGTSACSGEDFARGNFRPAHFGIGVVLRRGSGEGSQ